MKKVLITYSSKTGNTKKLVTEAVALLGEGYDIDIKTIKETGDYDEYDLIVPAFWIDKGTANKEAKKFIEKIRNKNVGFLATLGASPDSEHGEKVKKNVPMLSHESNNYMGFVLARGKVDPKLTARLKFLPLPSSIKDQMYEASISSREPNEAEFKEAAEFLKSAIEKL